MDDQTNSLDGNEQPVSSGLEAIRKEALGELVPLIDSMDVPAERKFEIAMTAVRVNFAESLLKKALEAAKQIDDPTAKAEALIDIVNETNYQEQETGTTP